MGIVDETGWQLVKAAAGFVASNAEAVVDAMGGRPAGSLGSGPGDAVLLRSSDATVDCLTADESLVELVLTQRSLVLDIEVDEGLFKKTRRQDYHPLAQLVWDDGHASADAERHFFQWSLELEFKNEDLSIRFGHESERQAKLWAEEVRRAAREIRRQAQSRRQQDKREAIEARPAQGQQTERPRAKMVATRCRACHAPLSGYAGSVAQCAYCDTKQTL